MNDDFLSDLQRDWRSQPDETATILRRLRRTRWAPHAVLALELLGCTVSMLIGVWFAWISAHTDEHQLLFALSASVLLITSPILGVVTVMARRASLAWHEETPDALLRIAIRRAESSLTAIRIGWINIAIVAAFIATLWILEALGLIQARRFLIFYTTLCLLLSLATWAWAEWRGRRVRRQRTACIRLLAALGVENGVNQ